MIELILLIPSKVQEEFLLSRSLVADHPWKEPEAQIWDLAATCVVGWDGDVLVLSGCRVPCPAVA